MVPALSRHVLPLLLVSTAAVTAAQQWPFDVTDLSQRESLTILAFGDSGTGWAGQSRVGRAMFDVCRQRHCDLAVMLGDVVYENGIEVRERDDADASLQEILSQFEEKFERPYGAFASLPGFHFWVALGNHDYRRNSTGALVTYSEFSDLWRLPALHYEVGRLPDWLQVHAVHTDTDVRRDLNGLQVASIRRRMCRDDSPDRWKILFGHHPVYNSGNHRNDTDERRTRALVEPLILDCGIDLYLAGHAHHQEHLTVRGYEQVIQGAAGKSKGSNNPPREPHVRQRFFSKTFGFAVISLDPQRMRIDFYDVRNTSEKADRVVAPTPDEIVMSYSWCATRDEIGRPDVAPTPCPAT
jgi:hypothetical protein